MQRAIIVDIDGTLADLSHRLSFVSGVNRDWTGFFSTMSEDTLIEPIRDLVKILEASSSIVLCSGRPEAYRQVTMNWLANNGVSFGKLYMRPDDDHRSDCIVKKEILLQMIADGYEPWLAIDDRSSVVRMWRENGITCLQCRDWDEFTHVETGILSLMIGPSGAGKSSWLASSAAADFGIHPSHIVSTDQIRVDLFGDIKRQDRNDFVFVTLHALIKARILHGLPTVVDATNIRRKDRLAILDLVPGVKIRYFVIDRSESEKRSNAGWRTELSFDLIGRHSQIFQSQLRDILAGDDRLNITIIDLRHKKDN